MRESAVIIVALTAALIFVSFRNGQVQPPIPVAGKGQQENANCPPAAASPLEVEGKKDRRVPLPPAGPAPAGSLPALDGLLTQEEEQEMLDACPPNRRLKVNLTADQFDVFIDDAFRVLNEVPLAGKYKNPRPIIALLENHDTIWKKHKAIKSGFWTEFGVFAGNTLLKAQNELLKGGKNEFTGVIAGFDSFRGLPEKWRQGFNKGRFGGWKDLYEAVRAKLDSEVELYRGWFQETINTFKLKHPKMPANLIHHDGDLFISTTITFQMLGDRIVPGTHVIFDELQGYPGYEGHEILAMFLWMVEADAELCAMGVREKIPPGWKRLRRDVHADSQSAWFQVLSTRHSRAKRTSG